MKIAFCLRNNIPCFYSSSFYDGRSFICSTNTKKSQHQNWLLSWSTVPRLSFRAFFSRQNVHARSLMVVSLLRRVSLIMVDHPLDERTIQFKFHPSIFLEIHRRLQTHPLYSYAIDLLAKNKCKEDFQLTYSNEKVNRSSRCEAFLIQYGR